MKSKGLLIFSIILLGGIFAMFVNPIWAGTTGKITGVVKDADTGEPLPGVNVIIEGTTMGAATDLEGYFVILNVPPGVYTVKASMIGYQTMKIVEVKVSVDFTTKVNFELQSTVIEVEEVVVTAERPLIRKDLTSTLAVIGDEEISHMPVEEMKEVLELQAGIVTGSGGETHIRGGRASEIAYLVDGISVTDPFSGNIAIEVENLGILELQVVSGTFNAEYGQAMSGVVDIVTKSGEEELHGELSTYVGDYVSDHTETFLNIAYINPLSINNLQGSLSGSIPGLRKKLYFYLTGRRYNSEGWLYGKRVFLPSDSSNFENFNPNNWYVQVHGDTANAWPTYDRIFAMAENVPMNPEMKWSAQGKLTYKISPNLNLSYGFLWDKVNYRDYNHSFKLNPDGNYQRHRRGYTHTLIWNHTLSSKTFYTLKFSNVFFDYRYYVYENPFDPRYVNPQRLKDAKQNAFYTGGTAMWHYFRNTTTWIGKFDITSQVNKTHQIKMGLVGKQHRLWLHEFEIIPKKDETGKELIPFQPTLPPRTSANNNQYLHHPIEVAAYIQDKIEIKDMVVNVGVRYDFFDPDGKIPTDLRDPDNAKYFVVEDAEGNRDVIKEDQYTASAGTIVDTWDVLDQPWTYKYTKARVKHQISPRVGIAYPITDRGVIHFSYGHFFQIPTFEYLYHNPEFEVWPGGLNARIGSSDYEANKMGNADLKAQKTVIYEIGLQQQLSDNLALDVTGFYKDVRNLLGMEIYNTYTQDKYARYVNRDYGNVRGITLNVEMRRSKYLSATLDYTYQVAEGNASDPDAVYMDARSIPPRESEIEVVPLDWDQTHTLNVSVTFVKPNNWSVSLLGRYGSGLPYTPAYQNIRTTFENSARKPPTYTFDLKAHKEFRFKGLTYSLFLKVYNLFDRKNERYVYPDTGRAGYTLMTRYAGAVRGVNTLEEYLNRPDFYDEPRRVIMGMSIGF